MSTPRFISGAVTMKMISSTSITSMYGTTLISAFSLRLRMRRPLAFMAMTMLWWSEGSTRDHGGRGWRVRQAGSMHACGSRLVLMGLAFQDGGELLAERVVAPREPLDLGRVAVVGPHRRNRGEQAPRGR